MPSLEIDILKMSWLQHILKKHLLFSALLLSLALHLVVIFWSNNEQLMQSSLGNNQLILLEPSKENHPAVNANEKSIKSAPTEENIQTGKAAPSTTGKVKEIEKDLPIQENVIDKEKNKTSEEKTKATSNTGELIDQSGKELTADEQYKNLVLNHLLNKAKSAPVNGAAIIHISIIRAGIATQINIELTKGGELYKNWLQHQVLSANPFPPLPKHINTSVHKLSFGISHD